MSTWLCDGCAQRVPPAYWRLMLPDNQVRRFCDRLCILTWVCEVSQHESLDAVEQLPRIVPFRRRSPLSLAETTAATGTDGR